MKIILNSWNHSEDLDYYLVKTTDGELIEFDVPENKSLVINNVGYALRVTDDNATPEFKNLPIVPDKIHYHISRTKVDQTLILEILSLDDLQQSVLTKIEFLVKQSYKKEKKVNFTREEDLNRLFEKKMKWKIFEPHILPLDKIYDLNRNSSINEFIREAKYHGFIIESSTYVAKKMKQCLYLVPLTMKHLYDENVITFDEMKNTNVLIVGSGIRRIIIHELHFRYLSAVKSLVEQTSIKEVYVINRMPLCIYLESPSLLLSIDKLQLYLNLWMNLNGVQNKIKWKHALNHCIINFLWQIYYKTPSDEPLLMKRIDLRKDETSLIFKFIQEIRKLEAEMPLDVVESYVKHYYGLIMKSGTLEVFKETVKIENNYVTDMNVVSECFICFDNSEIKVMFACGHEMCFPCFIKSYTHSETCPVCKIDINLTNIFLRQSIINFKNYFTSLVVCDTFFITTHLVIYEYLVLWHFNVIHPKYITIKNVVEKKWKKVIVVGEVTMYEDFVWKIVTRLVEKKREVVYLNF